MTQEHHLHNLLELFNQVGSGSHNELRDMLALANKTLGTTFGIISHISEQTYEVVHVDAPADTLGEGALFELGQTYCAITLEANDLVSIEDMASSSYSGHPCYASFGLETYIGAPLVVHGERYGTVNFSSAVVRQRPWTPEEQALVKLLARFVEQTLERQQMTHRAHLIGQELERMHHEQKMLISRLSHDFRAPLRNVRQLSEWILEDEEERLSEDGANSLQLIRERAAFAEEMLATLIHYARAAERYPSEPVHLDALFAHVIASLLEEDQHAYTPSFEVPEGELRLPRPAVRDAVFQMLRFAVRHTQERIDFKAYVQKHTLHIDLTTDGPQISERLFEPYFTSFSEQKEPERVRLTLARQRARAHDGDLSFSQSTPEHTVLSLTWPIG